MSDPNLDAEVRKAVEALEAFAAELGQEDKGLGDDEDALSLAARRAKQERRDEAVHREVGQH